ncbi:MAG: hypothetical protein AB7S80_00380 [Rhizobiaceae bacterium]
MFLLRFLRRLFKLVLFLIILVILVPIVGLGYGFLTTSSIDRTALPGTTDSAPPATLAEEIRTGISGYERPEEATYLGYPEGSILQQARDYASFVKAGDASGFPFLGYVGRFWQDYAMAIRATSDQSFDFSQHGVLVVAGTGYTIDSFVQFAYENTIGRLTEWASGKRTAADGQLAANAADYAGFLATTPWYAYPYAGKRAALLAVAPAANDDMVRSTERRWAFVAAYSVKQGVADLMRLAMAGRAPASPDIHVWARGPVSEAIRPERETYLERDMGKDGAVFMTRRQQAFTGMIPRLIERGLSFVEIGGNDEILMTMLSPETVSPPQGSRVLFSYPVPATPDLTRTALIVAVRKLHTVLPELTGAGVKLEQIFDY